MYPIQYYVIKHVSGFLLVLGPPIKLTTTDITEILLKMALNTIDQTKSIGYDKDPLWLLNINLSMPMQLKADQENSCMHYNIESCSALLID
jgi:hypothetical protein